MTPQESYEQVEKSKFVKYGCLLINAALIAFVVWVVCGIINCLKN